MTPTASQPTERRKNATAGVQVVFRPACGPPQARRGPLAALHGCQRTVRRVAVSRSGDEPRGRDASGRSALLAPSQNLYTKYRSNRTKSASQPF